MCVRSLLKLLMVHCDPTLLQLAFQKSTELAKRLGISLPQNQATPYEQELLSGIISHLGQSLLALQGEAPREVEGYSAIEQVLQRQQSLNRSFIRRELQFKEYQKCVMDELAEEKKIVKGLQEQLMKVNQKVLAKDLELLQLGTVKSKELKRKELVAVEALITQRKLGNPFKTMKQGAFTLHRRGNSDELALRSSTTKLKKNATGTLPKK